MAKFELYQAQAPLLDFKEVVKKLFPSPHFLTLSFDNILCTIDSSCVFSLYGVFLQQNKNQAVFQL